MNFQIVLNQVLIIFVIIIIGYVAARLGYITREVKRGIIELLVNIAIPAMVIVAFDTDLPASALNNARIVLLYAVLSHVLAALLGQFLFRSRPDRARVVLCFATVFTNCAFIGYPIMGSIFGTEGIFYTSIYSLVFSFFLWTYGQILFTGRKPIREMIWSLVNAGTVSVVIGMALLMTPLKLPALATSVLTMLGATTTPLAMLVIGAMLAEVRLTEMFRGRAVFFVTALRLALLPAATYAIMRLLGADARITAFCTIMTGLPAASNAVIFANKFDGDGILATRIVIITTALSIITIPLLASLLA